MKQLGLFTSVITIVILFSWSCSLTDHVTTASIERADNPLDLSEETEAHVKSRSLDIINLVLTDYIENGFVTVSDSNVEELGAGIYAEIPELEFISEETETAFYEECEALLAQELADDYIYVCQEISPVTGLAYSPQSRYTTLLDKDINEDRLGPDMGPARVLIRRHWVLKYYLTLEVDRLDDQCAYLNISLTTNKGDTHSASTRYEKNLKVKSSQYKKRNGGKDLKATYSYVKIEDPTVPGGFWSFNFSSGNPMPGPSPYRYYDKTISGNYTFVLNHVYYKGASDGQWKWNKAYDGWQKFEENLTENNDIKHMFVGYLRNPPPADVTNLVLCIAGQQGSQADSTAVPSVVTGQLDNWHSIGTSGQSSWRNIYVEQNYIRKGSMAAQIYYDMHQNNGAKFGLKNSDTFLGVVFDSTFYYGLASWKKNELEKAFAEWLLSQSSDLSRVKNIYLVGASMGGGLSVRIAEYIRDNSPDKSKLTNAKVIVSTFDGVGNTGVDIEIDRNDKFSSPYTLLGNKCWGADLRSYFTNEVNTHIYQISGGDAVVDVFSDARGFHIPNDGSFTKFTWVSLSHLQIGRWYLCPNLMDLQLSWFTQHRRK